MPVVALLAATGTTTMLDQVVHRYATITTRQPQNRYRLMERSLLISAPMFKGTSMPRSARTTVEKNVHWPHPVREEAWKAKELAVWCPMSSNTIAATPMTIRQKEYSTNWTFT